MSINQYWWDEIDCIFSAESSNCLWLVISPLVSVCDGSFLLCHGHHYVDGFVELLLLFCYVAPVTFFLNNCV